MQRSPRDAWIYGRSASQLAGGRKQSGGRRLGPAFILALLVGVGVMLVLFLRGAGRREDRSRVELARQPVNGGGPAGMAHPPPPAQPQTPSAPQPPPSSGPAPEQLAEPPEGGIEALPRSPGYETAGRRPLRIPVLGLGPGEIRDNFNERRGSVQHQALDIFAPRGTPVVAVDDGFVRKLFTSKKGGLTVYQFDAEQNTCYYYAHLDGYAPGLREGLWLKRGEVLGYVGTTGNAPPNAPHLHFEMLALGPEKRWWEGTPVNPYPLLVEAE